MVNWLFKDYPSLRKLAPYLRRYLKLTGAGLFCMLIYSASNVGFLYFIKKLLRPIIEAGNPRDLILSGIEFVGVGIVMSTSNFLQNYISNYVGQKMLTDVRQDLFAHMQSLSLAYFENKRTGEIMSRMTNDLNAVQRVMNLITLNMLAAPLSLVGILVFMWVLSWKLTLISCVGIPLIALVIGRWGKKAGIYARRVQEQMAEISGILQERITGIRIIQCFTREEFESDRFRKVNEKSLREIMKGVRVSSGLVSIVDIISIICIVAVLCVGGLQAIHHTISPTTLLTFLAAINTAVGQAKKLSTVVVSLRQMEASVARLYHIFETKPDIQDRPDATQLESVVGSVRFDHVSFAYSNEIPVLRDVTFEIQPGETVALVGPSGAGKTTIANMIPRLYDPTSGCIVLDEQDLRSLQLRSLRGHIGIVPQEAFLFVGTVYENIIYGRLEATREEVYEAARKANAHDFICGLPQEYDSIVGERGATLSGGQRQRVAIARALLRDPRILVLDEATSSLDAESEALVQEALDKLMENRTTLVIAHRLSTIKKADRILVMERGRIVEEGTHPDLVRREGLYSRLYETQMSHGDSLDANRPALAVA